MKAIAVVLLGLVGCVASVSRADAALQCYKVKDSAAKATYTADLTGLAPEPGCQIKVPGSLICVDSTVTSASAPIPDRPGGDGGPVLCYKIKCPKNPLLPITWNDPLGVREVQPSTPSLVCSTGMGSPVIPPPSNKWTSLISRSSTLDAGSEGYKCRTIQLPTDMYLTGFRAVAPLGSYWIVLTVSDSAPPGAPTGDFDCSAGFVIVSGRSIYAAGMGTNDLILPPGVAVHLKAGQFLTMNLHLRNATAKPVTHVSGVQVQTGSAADVTDEAEMIFGGTFNISLPSDGHLHTAQGGCAAPQDYHAFALWPHMHGLGTRIQLVQTHSATGTSQTLLDTPYMLTAQQVYPMTPVLVQQGDQLQVTCSYVNTTGQTVMYGDTSLGEQCFMGIYRYPVSPVSNLFECTS